MVRVLKFGGASVATPASFSKIADIIIEHACISTVAVVISAMGDTTDELFDLAYQVNPNPPKRELDMLVSAGERISIALLAMALSKKGKEAVSFTGSQSGIITDETHSDAKIIDVRPKRLYSVFEKGQIAIVAGFQGVSTKGEITTLGRGGSDTTAVALGVALDANEVVFYKDVAGIYTSDPKKDIDAKLISKISYRDAYAVCAAGSQVLHPRCIKLAEKNGVKLSVRSFYTPFQEGTLVGDGVRINQGYEQVEECKIQRC